MNDPYGQQQDPSQGGMWDNMTPQQKMGLMMSQQQQPQSDPRGNYSAAQGLSQITNGLLRAQLMKQGQQGPQSAPIDPAANAALAYGGQMGSTGPTLQNAALMDKMKSFGQFGLGDQ